MPASCGDGTLELSASAEVQQLKGVVQQLYGHLNAQQQEQAQRRLNEATKAITKFSADKTDWADLESDITEQTAILKKANPDLPMEDILAKAYDRARWANPNTRQRIQGQERKAEADKAQKELGKKQAEAKKFAATNVRSGAMNPTPTVGKKWDDPDALSAIYDAAQTR